MKTILTKEIRSIIDKNGPNKLYVVSDFAHLNNDGLVTRALSRLEKEGMLIRLSLFDRCHSKGTYYREP